MAVGAGMSISMGHRIALISYRDETIECTCGVILTAESDAFRRDRHQPLADAWAQHRIAVGETTFTSGGRKGKRSAWAARL